MRYFIFSILLISYGSTQAQDQQPPMKPGRTVATQQHKEFADSAEFAKLFKEFFPLIKPEKSMKEQSDQYFMGVSRAFKMQGIDSAEAAKVAYKNLDDKAFEKIYFDTYRRNLSAKELKKYMEFLKTPEGKHINSVFPSLQRVSTDANMYIARTMNLNLAPLRQEAHEKMEKEHPGSNTAHPPTQRGNVDAGDPKHSALRDSLVRMQQMQNRLPKSTDSLSTTQPGK